MSTSATELSITTESPAPQALKAHAFLFGITILAGACLLFLVQPLISKLILPWFGGSAAVWITSMLFFQLGLLGGYLYAHMLTRAFSVYGQAAIHGMLLVASITALPILPNLHWQPKPGVDPTWKVLGALATSVGLPYILLSATSPLVQSWYAARSTGVLPYRYFALSNMGSMLALLSYPVLIDPFLRGRNQAWLWSSGYFLFVLLCVVTAAVSSRAPREEVPVGDRVTLIEPLSRISVALWIALAASASSLLLTVTNLLTQNIAPMPLLWVVPLSIYLFSFILAFENNRWYQRWLFLPLLPVSLYWLASHTGTIETPQVGEVVPLICGALFVCCMTCHGELSRLKPALPHLTAFYLSIAVGGAVGGVFVALFAPHFFTAAYEYPISYISCAVLLLIVLGREKSTWRAGILGQLAESCWIIGLVGAGLLIFYAGDRMHNELEDSVAQARNFYGALLVEDVDDGDHKARQLSHGTITHGVQLLDPNFREVPTSYYGRDTGAGLAYSILEKQGPMKLGVVGLGAGTMAAYGRGGDTIRFYDLNPLVVRIAHQYFTFLADCPAHVDIVMGDARLSLARERSQQFDMLVIDAFAGDAVPVHLLTREAFDIYWRHLKPDGVLAVHISNQYLNLAPVVWLDAKARGLRAWEVDNDADDSIDVYNSNYILVSNRNGFFDDTSFENRLKPIWVPRGLRRWTDDFSSLWPILRVGALSNR